mgnify:CR=1 FL=1
MAELTLMGPDGQVQSLREQSERPKKAFRLPDGRVVVWVPGATEQILRAWSPDGSEDPTFQIDPLLKSRHTIRDVVMDPAGGLVLANAYISDNQNAIVARLGPGGTLDPGFLCPIYGQVWALETYDESTLLVAGKFTLNDVHGSDYYHIARIQLSGSLDPGFSAFLDANPRLNGFFPADFVAPMPGGRISYRLTNGVLGYLESGGQAGLITAPEVNGQDFTAEMAPDGSLYLSGDFTEVGGVLRPGMARLGPNGDLDLSFAPPEPIAITARSDESLLIQGDFDNWGGESRSGVALVDWNFNLLPGLSDRFASDGFVKKFHRFEDGSILVLGKFDRFVWLDAQYPAKNIVKLLPDGRPDFNFRQTFFDRNVTSAMIHPDDSLIVGFEGAPPVWERYDRNGVMLGGLPEGLNDLSPAIVMDATQLENGALSFFARSQGRGYFRRVLIADDYRMTIGPEAHFGGFESISKTRDDGRNYFLESPSSRGISSFHLDEIPFRGDFFSISIPSSASSRIHAFEPLSGQRFLIASEDGNLQVYDAERNVKTFFQTGSVQTSGQIRRIWALEDRQQYFIAGTFSRYNGTDLRGFAQLRYDGTIESSFNLGERMGISGQGVAASSRAFPTELVALDNGRILIGGWGNPMSIDGHRVGGIAMLEPVAQDLQPAPGSPQQVSAAAISAASVLISWQQEEPGIEVMLERRKAEDRTWQSVARKNSDEYSHVDWVEGEGTYFYRITLINPFGTSRAEIQVDVPLIDLDEGRLDDRELHVFNHGQVDHLLRLNGGSYLAAGTFNIVAGNRIQEDQRPVVVRLNPTGEMDDAFPPIIFTDSSIQTITALAEQSDGRVLVGLNSFREERLIRFHPNGQRDDTFAPPRIAGEVKFIRILDGGKIFLGGNFITFRLNGLPPISNILIIEEDGSFDPNQPGWTGSIVALAPGLDSHFYVGGKYHSNHCSIARFKPDGTLDETFVVDGQFDGSLPTITGIGVQPDGRILVGGWFDEWRYSDLDPEGPVTLELNHLAVFDPLGRLDREATIRLKGTNGRVRGVATTPAGTTVIVGDFSEFSDLPRQGLAIIDANHTLIGGDFQPLGAHRMTGACLQSNGEVSIYGAFGPLAGHGAGSAVSLVDSPLRIKEAFVPQLFHFNPLDVGVRAFEADGEGGMFVGGRFDGIFSENGFHHTNNLARLLPDGGIDTNFQVFEIGKTVYALATDLEGNLLVGGSFLIPRDRDPSAGSGGFLARMGPDGGIDESFSSGNWPDALVADVEVDELGRILLSGYFKNMGSQPRPGLARLDSSGMLDTGFAQVGQPWGSWFRAMTTHQEDIYLEAFGPRFRTIQVADRQGVPMAFPGPSFEEEIQAVVSPVSGSDSHLLIGGKLRGESHSGLYCFDTSDDFSVRWSIPFNSETVFQGILDGGDTSFVFGDLRFGDRQASIMSFNPETGNYLPFQLGASDAPPRALALLNENVLVGGSFSRWDDHPRFGMALLQQGQDQGTPSPPEGLEARSSREKTLLRWETDDESLAYRIELKEEESGPWRTIGVRNNQSGGFLINRGRDALTTARLRLVALDGAGRESLPVEFSAILPMRFDSWKVAYGISTEVSAQSDFDGDGISLLIEYALGLNPRTSSTLPSIEVGSDGATWTIENSRPDVLCSIQTSKDLGAWETSTSEDSSYAARGPLVLNLRAGKDADRYFRVKAMLVD